MNLLARAIVWLRWPIVIAWIAGAVTAHVLLPSIEDVRGGAVGTLVPDDAAALDTERLEAEKFGLPALARAVVVQRDPEGLSAPERADVARRAVALTRARDGEVAAAVPVIPGLVDEGTDRLALTYLHFGSDDDAFEQAEAAEAVAARVAAAEPDMLVRATGTTPSRAEEAGVVLDWLRWVEIGTGLLVFLIVGVAFRALGPPLLALVATVVAYVLSTTLLAAVAPDLDVSVPREVQPVIVVLVFGVVTDYSVFFLSRGRARLAAGDDRRDAARAASAGLTGIVSVAALSVAAAGATLMLADLGFLSAFGPGMAVSVLVAALVAITFVPAAMAIGGRRLFSSRQVEKGKGSEDRGMRGAPTRFAARHPRIVVMAAVLLLAGGASGLWFTELSNPLFHGLPSDSGPAEGYRAVADEAAPGAVAPTTVLVSGRRLDRRGPALERLQALLGEQPGVAAVLGPAEQPLETPVGLTVSEDGEAARFLLVPSTNPLGAGAIDRLGALERRLPGLLESAGLEGSEAALAGDTALAQATIDRTLEDLARVGPAAVAAVFLVLALYLRAVVAPLAIMLASVLGLAATIGAATWFFQELLGQDALVFYVPLATAVLLLSLGADYSVFLAGRVWDAAGRRGMAEAVRVGGTRAAGPITTAAFVLAASFALLAIVPLRAFHQIAFTMAVGLLIDGFIVRTLLVPALLAMGSDDAPLRRRWRRRAAVQRD